MRGMGSGDAWRTNDRFAKYQLRLELLHRRRLRPVVLHQPDDRLQGRQGDPIPGHADAGEFRDHVLADCQCVKSYDRDIPRYLE
jgi:hypothetical protein